MPIDFRSIQSDLEQFASGKSAAQSGGDLVEFARTQAQELGVPVEIAERLIRLESGGRADAVSPKGAFGPAQLMPKTAKELASKYGGDPSNPYDNIRLGMHYLRDNYDQFGDWRLAAAAYQAGPGSVKRAGGIPNTTDGITSTPDYVRKVVGPGLGVGAMMPTPRVPGSAPARDAMPGAVEPPMPTGDYSEFQPLPQMEGWQGSTISGLDDVVRQQAENNERARIENMDFGDKLTMGFKKGAVQSLGLLGGLGAAAGDALDIESLQKAGMDLYTRQMEKAQEYSVAPSFTDVVDGKAELSDWLAENIGYGVYQVTEALATGGAGALLLKGAMKPAAAGMMKGFVEREVGKTLAAPIEAEARKLIAGGMAVEAARSAAEKTVVAKVGEQAIKAATDKAAKIAAATLATTANNFRQELGSIYGEAAENNTVDWQKILPAAAGATALDTLAEVYFGAKVLGTGAGRSGGYAARLAKELPAQMAVQGGTEGGQSAIEQWGAGKESIDLKQVADEAAVGGLMGGLGAPVSAMQKKEQPAAPSGVLGRAAQAGQAATPAGSPTPVDPNAPNGGAMVPAGKPTPIEGVAARISALMSRIDGDDLLNNLRQAENFGPESATELLRALAIARNGNIDPMQRRAAIDGAERLVSAFDSRPERPNFTMPPSAPEAGLPAVTMPGGAVAATPEPGVTVDGEFSRYGGELSDPNVPATRRLPPAAVRALPDPEKQRVLREAEAEYDQAFADLLKVDQLASSEQQLRDAALARQYAEARLAEIQEAIAGSRAAYSAQVRRSLLDEILADPQTANPLERFEAEMRRQGYAEPAARPEEVARVQRFIDIRDAKPAAPEVEPSTPNEMDPGALGVRERRAQRPDTPRTAAPAAPLQPMESVREQGIDRPGSAVLDNAGAGIQGGDEGAGVAVQEVAGIDGGRSAEGAAYGTGAGDAEGGGRQDRTAVDAGVPDAALSAEPASTASAEPAPEDLDKRVELDVAADVTNTAPTEAQKQAGNYQKGRVSVQGFPLAIESPKGSVRRGVDKDGTEWTVTMPADYGYIERTEGADGDQVDAFIGDRPETGLNFVVNQNRADSTRFDEHKVMLGFSSEDAAIDTYFDSFSNGFGQRLFHSIDGPYTAEELRALLPKLKKAKPVQEKAPAGEVVPAEAAGDRADLRPELEALIRMKAGARQIGKEDALQAVIDRAKAYMQGGAVEPGVFVVRAKQFKDLPVVQQTIDSIVEKIRASRAPAAEATPAAPAQPEPAAAAPAETAEPAPLPNATAPEHVQTGVDDRELSQIVSEFNSAQKSMIEDGERVTHVFDPPAKKEVVRLNDKVKVFTKENGWMTPEQARARIAEWKAHAQAQGDDPQIRSANSQKVVLSLFDLSGEWSKPWEEAGYQVFRFDIQDDPTVGDVNNFSTDFFQDWFGDFEGMDIHAVLAACPCTDFAVSGARHFAAKDKDGRTVASVKLVHQTLRVIEYFKPAVWAVENPVGRIEELGGLPPWRLSFDPNHLGDPYTKKTLLWGRFNGDLPIAPVEPTEGSKMHRLYGGKSQATKNARSVTPEGFSYGFFMANNAHDHPAMALANKFDRLDRDLIKQAIDVGVPTEDIETAVEDAYYIEMDDEAGNQAIRDLISAGGPRGGRVVEQELVAPESDNGPSLDEARDTLTQLRAQAREQGRVSDDRLNERIRMFERLVAELEAEKAPAVPVPGIYGNGMPDPRNSPPLLELDGFKVGDRVRVKGRTVDDAQIDVLFKRALPGFDKPDHMARLTRGEGMTPLDVQVFSLEKIGGDTVSGNPLRAELEQMSGEELRAVMDRMSLAGARMTHDERVATLLAEDEAEVRAAMVAPVPAPAADAKPEVRNPQTFDEFVGDVDAGYRAHFDYAGTDGTTVWIEQTEKGWVVKQKDDDSSAVITKGGAGAGGGWGKLGALTAAKNLASYRFKEWKPVVAETSAQNERKAESGKSDYENDPYEREAARMEVRPIEGSDEFIVGYRADNGWHNFIRFALSEKTGRPVRVEYFYEHQSGRVPAKMALDRWVEGRKQAGSRQDSGKSEQQAPLASTASRQGAQPSANTIFTEDAAAKAREVLRRKLGQLNTGLDPEILQAGITLAGYHIEKGARKFAAYARAMLDDMGDAVKPYLKSWYMGVKYDPRAAAFSDDMSSAAEVDAADVSALQDDKSTADGDMSSAVDEKQQQADAVADAIGKAIAASPVIVEHVTGKGKTIRGIVRTDLTHSQAKEVDPFTFRKDGGFFIREKYLDQLPPAVPGQSMNYDEGKTAERDGNEQNGNGGGNESALAPVSPGVVSGAREDGPAGSGGGSGSRSDVAGNGRAAEDVRDQRAGSMAGEPGAVLPEGSDEAVTEVVTISGEEKPLEEIAQSMRTDAPASEPKPKSVPRQGDNPGNYSITDEDAIGTGTTGERIRANMAAVRLVLQLERENRYPTREEQRVLAKYVGWGGLKNVFKGDNSTSKQEREAYAELKRILTPDQLFWMGQSVLDAHYTAPRVVRAMYRVLKHFGIEGGRFIEPTVGVGNFIGLQPAEMAAGSKWFASEIDPVTSLIARHLYPESQVLTATGFQNAEFAYGRFDVAIGNPPFGDQRITDTNKKRADISGFKIHNYIIAKSAMHLRPGGIMAFVVTSRFLDTSNPEAREYLARNFRFLGAFRLPNNAFKENAGTEVTTDIIFLQRMRDGETADVDSWLDTDGRLLNEDGETVRLNRYFAENPELMLGKPSMQGTMYGGRGDEFTLQARDGLDIDAEIDRLLSEGRLGPAGLARVTDADREVQAATVEINREDVPIGGYFRDGDRIIQRTDDDAEGNVQFRELTPETPWTEKQSLGETRLARIRGIMEMRDMAYDLMAAERGDMDVDQIEGKRRTLNERYDEFVKEHGFLNDKANRALFDDDPRIEFGLESNYRKGISAAVAKKMGTTPMPPAADKSSLLIERVFYPRKEVESADNPRDGYSISLSERGRLDLEYIADLTGMSVDAVIEDLSGGERPLIFRDPASNKWVQEDAYLSGNVKEKLKLARGAGLDVNVRALEAVQPADVAPEDIHVEFGATWVPAEVYVDFLRLFGVRDAQVAVMPLSGSVEVLSVTGNEASPFKADIENPDYTLAALFSAVANRRKLVAYDGTADTRVLNQERTDNLGRIRRKLLAIWSDWIKADPERSDKLAAVYNEVMNTTIERQFDGVTHLRTVGTNPAYSLRNSQKNSAWRMIQSSEVLLDHVVGAGKTMALTTGIMERKRLGLSKKPMVMVPNHLVGQWAREWLALYPGANILAATEKDFARSNRRRLFARIATGKFDAVIVGHTSFGYIPVSPEAEVEFIMREVEHLEQALTEAKMSDKKGKGESRQVRAIKNRIAKRTEKIKELQDKPRDNVATFEDMGIDYLAIDEFHEFKNLEYSTTLSNVAGMNSPEGSKKAFDLFMKIRLLQEAGGGIAAATGTPLSNSMVEMYTVLRYLNPGALERRNLQQFDAWVKAFASIEQRDEYTASGNLKARTVMASFNNLPELLQMYKQVADTVTMTDLKRIYADQMREENARLGTSKREEFPVPKVKDGGRRLDIGAPTPEQVEFMDYLIARANILDRLKGREKQEYATTDNALWLMNDARKMSLDVRIIDPTVPDNPNNKVNRAARKIKDIYDRTEADLGTQLVFCDLSTPTKSAEKAARDFIRDAIKKLGLEKNAAVVNSLDGLNYVDKWKALEVRADLMLEGGTLSDDERERVEKFMESVGDDERSALVVADSGFSVYDDLKNKLIASGIPENEIVFIHDANTSEQKRDLFELVNAGKVRVLIGSSMKMGAGTNAQRRLVALHHMDAPWRPSDMEQREGRIVRQGNMLYERDPDNFQVEIVAYSTERTFDAQMWGVLARKAGFLEQFRKGLRTIKEEASDADSYAEFMAEATGDQIFRDKIRLEREVEDLDAEDRSSKMKRQAAENTLSSGARRMAEYQADLEKAERYATADLSSVTFDGQTYRNDLAEVIDAADAEYNAQMEVFREQEEQYKVARKAWEDAAGTDRGRAPTKPVRPELPRLMSDRIRQSSEWARFIDAFTKKLELMPKDVAQHRFVLTTANGVELPVIAKWSGFREDGIEVRITEFGSRRTEQSRSDNMAGLFTPRQILSEAKDSPRQSRWQLQSLKQAIAQAEATLQRVKPVDPAVLEKARAELADVKARVEAISQAMAEERAQRRNRFIERDTKRFGVGGKTVSDMRAEAAPAAIPESARFKKMDDGAVVYVQSYTDVSIAGLEDYTFFASKNANGKWSVTENTTGFSISGSDNATRKGAVERALAAVQRIGVERAREVIDSSDKMSEDGKRAALKKATDLPPVVERRGAPRASAPGVDVQGQITVADIDAAINRFRLAKEFRQIAFHPVETFADLPAALRAEVEQQYGQGSNPKGLMKERDGIAHVYLIAASHESAADVEATILHEVMGHVGVRRLFGADVTQALNKLFVSIGGVRGMMKIADARGFGNRMGEYAVAIDGSSMTQDVKLQVMMEEVLAHIAEDPRFMDRVKAIVGMIRQWLRDAGLAKLSEMGETDLLAMLSRGRRALSEPGATAGPTVERRSGARTDTPASIRRALVKRFGEAGITALESGGILRIVPTWDSLPERIRSGGEPNGRAFYDAGEGAAYLIADRLSAGTAPGVLLHEIGEHYGLRRMLGERGYTGLVSKVRAMAKKPESIARAMWDSVRNNYDEFRGREDADLAADERFMSEVVARMGEEAVFQESSLWRDIKAALQRFLLKMGLPVSLDEFDVMALVEGSLKHAMRTTRGPAPRGGMEPAFAKAKAASDAPLQASVASGLRDFMESTPTRRALSDKVADLFRTQKTFNWWNRTIGSQYHKAQKDPEFGRVFRLAQDYLDDVSRIASEAANKAGKLLPQLETVGEAFSGLRTMRRDAADAAALAGPVFHGTLMDKVWTDDELMNPPVDPLSRAPLFDALTPAQIELYREFRAAVDKSLDDLAVSEMARLAKASKMDVAPVGLSLTQTAQFYYEQFGGRLETLEIERADLVRTHNGERKLLEEAATDLPEGSAGRRAYLDQVDEMRARQRAELKALDQELAGLEVLRTGFLDKAAKISTLKAKGYAPLMRFGQYTVDVFLQKTDSAGNPMLDDKGEPEVVRDNDGEPIRPFFGMFESEREANEAARMLQEEYPDYTIRQGVLSQNAYELFKGVTPETVELFGQMIGAENEVAFQSYLKLAVSNRSAMKRLIQRKGMAGFAQDPSRVLAAFILSNARAAAGNWHFGDMLKAAAVIPKTKGDVKDEAVKLMSYVQNPQEEASVIRGILFAQHLGGSIASALVNMTQSFTTTYPYLHQFGEGSAAAVGEGMRMAAKLSVRKDANIADPALREALDRATEEGIVSPHEIHLLMGQANPTSAFGSNRLMRNVMRLWGSFYSLAERFNRHAAFIAGWKMAMQRGMAPEAAYQFAKQTVTETQFVYSKANKPNWARGAVGATLFTFKTFLVNYIEFLKRLPAKERALALAVLLAAAGLSGMPGADDLDDLIDTIGQALGFATNTKQAKQEFAARWLGKDAAGFLLHGVSYGLPLDLSSRLGVGNLIPGTAIFKKSEQDKSGEVMEAVGPAAGLAQSFARGFEAATSGEVMRGGAELLPKAFKDAFKAKEMYQTGLYKDFRGRTVTDVDAIDAMVKAIGFQPTDVAEVQRARVRMQDTVNLVKAVESDIAEKWARGLGENDREAVATAREQLADWNRRNPDTPIKISYSQIQRRVNELRRTAADRLVKATPRELRAMVREGVTQ